MSGLCQLFSRLTVAPIKQTVLSSSLRCVSTSSVQFIAATPCLFREPMRKKARLDVSIIRAREERKRKKIEKMIKRATKYARYLKPIEELQIPRQLIQEKEKRTRQNPVLSPEDMEKRILLIKEWANYRRLQQLADVKMLDRIAGAQQHALDELRHESEELYQAAIEVDLQLLPFTIKGPSLTPPLKTYDSPDGDYIDESFKWE